MKKILFIVILAFITLHCQAKQSRVIVGAEQTNDYLPILKNKRIAVLKHILVECKYIYWMGQWNEKVVFYLCTLLNIGRLQECTLLYDKSVHYCIAKVYILACIKCTLLF